MKAVNWLLAWFVMFLLIYALSKTKWGNVIIYYTTWLLIFLLIVGNYRQLLSILISGGF